MGFNFYIIPKKEETDFRFAHNRSESSRVSSQIERKDDKIIGDCGESNWNNRVKRIGEIITSGGYLSIFPSGRRCFHLQEA